MLVEHFVDGSGLGDRGNRFDEDAVQHLVDKPGTDYDQERRDNEVSTVVRHENYP